MEKSIKVTDVYKFEAELGQGSFAKVYRAWHRNTGQKVAIKIIKKEELSDEDKMAL
jgi:serine/threonine protein kinase